MDEGWWCLNVNIYDIFKYILFCILLYDHLEVLKVYFSCYFSFVTTDMFCFNI